MKKYFDLLCILMAGFFFAASIALFILPMTGFCSWAEPIFGPAVVCDFQFLAMVFMSGSILSWYWIGFILLTSFEYFASAVVALPAIAVNILALRGFAIVLKLLPIFRNRKVWRGFLIGLSVFVFLALTWVFGGFAYLISAFYR